MLSKIFNIVLFLSLCALTFVAKGEISELRSQLDQSGKKYDQLQVELAKQSDEALLLRKVVMANLSKIADPIPNRTLTVTAYTPSFGEDSLPTLTASNSKAKEGIVAVSRDLFAQGWVFGKKVYIKDHGIFTISDLMAQTRARSIDILMNDEGRANEFGKRKLEVVLLDV